MIIQKLKAEISAIQAKIDAIQTQCSHPRDCVVKTPHGNGEDHYWNDCICQLCEKRWHEDQ